MSLFMSPALENNYNRDTLSDSAMTASTFSIFHSYAISSLRTSYSYLVQLEVRGGEG